MRSKVILGIVLIASSVVLSGCSNVLYNREFSYMREEVKQTPTLKTPEGMDQPDLKPTYTLPDGPDQYAPEKKDVDVVPPGLDKTYTKEEMEAFKAQKPVDDTMPQTKEALEKKIAEVKAQLAAAKAGETGAAPAKKAGGVTLLDWMNGDYDKPQNNQSEAQKQKLAEVQKQMAEIKEKLSQLKTADGKLVVVPELPPLILISSDLSDDSTELTFDAGFNKTWEAVGSGLARSEYSVTGADKAQGLYFIAPKGIETQGHTWAVYVDNMGGEHTDVQVFDANGQLSNSSAATGLLNFLHTTLKP